MHADSSTDERLSEYVDMLVDASQQFNLTSVRDRSAIEDRLVNQSLFLASYIPETCRRLVDVGTGAGIPGVPIAVVRPDIDVFLLDATAKKITFLDAVVSALSLKNVTTLQDRAESLAHDPGFRESFDVVTARAVSRLAALAEFSLPFLRIGGVALLPKSESVSHELTEAGPAIEVLGGADSRIIDDERLDGVLVTIAKRRSTPERYPRRPGIPGKRPIGVPSRA